MNLRHIVPALGLMALTSAPALAADVMPNVSFEGWVDTILSISDDDRDDNTTTAKDEESLSIGFSSVASLKANWKVTDALSARVNLWFDAETSEVWMREAYFAWALNDSVTWSMGKYIDHLGWIAAEPTGLYTVNASLIGYTSTYGNDVLGTSIGFAPKDSPFSGSFHVTNGYYTSAAAFNGYIGADIADPDGDPRQGRENTDLGFGLDLIFDLPDDKGSLNLEFAYDMHSDGLNNAADELGGDVFLVGFNATVTPTKPLTIGAEIQYLMLSEAEDTGGDIADSDASRLQGMLLANYAIEGASVPMSVTGMVQYVTIDTNDVEDETRIGGAVALLTNPLGSSNFGLNFEVGLYDIADEGGTAGADDTGFVVAMEGLVTF